MNLKQMKKFLKQKGYNTQDYEITEGSSKKDTTKIEYLKYVLKSRGDK